MPPAVDLTEAVFVARQPILFPSGRVFGYELLCREDPASAAAEGETAAARVFTDAMLNLGLDTLTGGLPAFLNFTRRLLVTGAGTVVPPAAAVFQIGPDIPVDDEVVGACEQLHAIGYSLAVEDFLTGSDAERLLPFARFVKVDVRKTTAKEREALAQRLLTRGLRLIAEHVDTHEAAEEARAAGYGLVQGYFFCKPATYKAKTLPARRMAYLHLLAALNKPDLSVGEVEDLIKHDVSLSYRVLRCVNSAAFGLQQEVYSVRQALVLMGVGQIRKWASVWALAGVHDGGPSETVAVAILRARCCELLGDAMGGPDTGSAFFLLGLCSLLDTILDRPMAAALGGLPLPAAMRNALLGQSGMARAVLDAVIAYERGDWEDAVDAAKAAGLPAAKLPAAYGDALRWARELSRQASAA